MTAILIENSRVGPNDGRRHMHDMALFTTLENGKFWQEEIPFGSVQSSSASFGPDYSMVPFTFLIDGNMNNVRQAISYLLGYSEVLPKFNPDLYVAQGPYRLNRAAPARHPHYPNLRATKILSVQGVGVKKFSKIEAGEGAIGYWETVRMTVQFEIPRYPILSNAENSIGQVPLPEYRRYHEFDYVANVETLARKDVNWAFANSALAGTASFKGDRMLRVAKGVLTIKGYGLANDWVFLGRTIPSNYHLQVSTLNALPFPVFGFRDQNQTGRLVQFRAGTCLLLPPKITTSAQMHPAVVNGDIDPTYFPRACNVETTMVVFDPPSDDVTTVDLRFNTDGSVLGGAAHTLVRGHNLAPTITPSATGFSWYTAYSTLVNAGVGQPYTNRQEQLLYQYSNFENLWKAPMSLPT